GQPDLETPANHNGLTRKSSKNGDYARVHTTSDEGPSKYPNRPSGKRSKQFHIVLDNTGPELLGDLILAEYLMGAKLVDKTVLHGKEYPYFVSDVTGSDFEWSLKELNRLGNVFQRLYEKLSGRIKKTALCGFLPAPILALRTLKSETVAGLPENVARRMRNEPDMKWMVTGEYGIAELAY
uniref:Sugar phosphate phosphatase n=1 Tax=Angiostrongylus cantonensis TaxID=6313 RepID=A0A0K0DER7_ANGCA